MPGPHDRPPHEHHGPPHEHHGPPHEHHGPPHEHHGPPHEHHGPPHEHHGPPPGAEWMENDRRKRNLKTIGEILQSIGEEIKGDGTTTLGNSEVIPPEEPTFVARYERLPEGHYQLHFSIRWNPRTGQARSGTPEDPFSEKITESPNESGGNDADDDIVGEKTEEG